MVWSHSGRAICKPPAKAFVPIERASDEEKPYVAAWNLLKEHLLPDFKGGNWTHEMVREWAAKDVKTPKPKGTRGVSWPPIVNKSSL